MKKTFSLTLTVILTLVLCLAAFAASADKSFVPRDTPDDELTDAMNATRNEVSRLFPGLKEVDEKCIDSSLPVIEVKDINELCSFMNTLNSVELYKPQTESSEQHIDYVASSSVSDMFPKLQVVDAESLDPTLPVIEFENNEELIEFLTCVDSSNTYKDELSLRSPYGGAKPYSQNNSTDVNCYGYAGEFFWFISPGDIHYYNGSPFGPDSTISEVAQWVQWDYDRDTYRECRSISSATSSVSSTEWRMALRIGKGYIYINGVTYLFADFHFMKQTNAGTWAHKPGAAPSILTSITNPSTASWHLYKTDSNGNLTIACSNFYNSATKYFAVKRVK